VADFPQREEHDPSTRILCGRSMFHGPVQTPKGDSIGTDSFRGHETAREFRENMEAPFSVITCTAKGETEVASQHVSERLEQLACYGVWPRKRRNQQNLYLHADGTLSFTAPGPADAAKEYRAYVSDPKGPKFRFRYGSGPISPPPVDPGRGYLRRRCGGGGPFSACGWPGADVMDVRERSMDHDIVVPGPLAAALFASIRGTDGDFVVKPESIPKGAEK